MRAAELHPGAELRCVSTAEGCKPKGAGEHTRLRPIGNEAAANERMMRAISPLSRTEVALRNSPFQLPNGRFELYFYNRTC